MVESILKGLKGMPQLQGPLQASIWDQGDAVGAWIGDKLVAVVFPTPETLPQVCSKPTQCLVVSNSRQAVIRSLTGGHTSNSGQQQHQHQTATMVCSCLTHKQGGRIVNNRFADCTEIHRLDGG